MEFDQIYSAYFKSVYLYVMQLSGTSCGRHSISADVFTCFY